MTKTAIFAAGCFWGIEEKFLSTDGVVETEVGYIGGKTSKPTYQDVCEGNTNHAEAGRVHYNEEKITYDSLLDIFFEYMILRNLIDKVQILALNIDRQYLFWMNFRKCQPE
ncbi:MAG: hypothetical protein Ct9H90mP18_05400 [Gammaproteobacteria bacterium]|nr:MAG: hypothetical protein Ct9H90mP18_05400 [Gammaproteobacteria bacterium]